LKLLHPISFIILLLFQTTTFEGKVVAVKDGDTIVVLSGKTPVKIRLHEIDCPELGQDFGRKAKDFTSAQCFEKNVRVIVKGRDYFGRTLGEIILPDKKSLTHELVKKGLAWHFKRYSKDKVLAELELNARKTKVGLWSFPNPIAPWEFRKEKKKRR
jgi:micrococcal nuclease